jgi:hypothetical protein
LPAGIVCAAVTVISGRLSDVKFEHVSATADSVAVKIHVDARVDSRNW